MDPLETGGAEGAAGAAQQAGVPPAPWRLRGCAHASLWQVPLPGEAMRPAGGTRVAALAGRTLVVTVWARYTSAGTLAYDELIAATVLRGSGVLAPACTVGMAWVDDETAARGGRALWHIPKELGAFATQPSADAAYGEGGVFGAALSQDGRELAALRFEPGWRLPGRVRFPVWTIQHGEGGPVRTRCLVSGRLQQGTAHWRFAAEGPLGFLHGRKPLASARLDELSADFGV